MSYVSAARRVVKLDAGLAAFIGAVLFAAPATTPQPVQERIAIEYVSPKNPAHKPLYDVLQAHKALERVQEFLVPIRWPRTLRLELRGCDGESNAWYGDDRKTSAKGPMNAG
jgi:hypothetical protein